MNLASIISKASNKDPIRKFLMSIDESKIDVRDTEVRFIYKLDSDHSLYVSIPVPLFSEELGIHLKDVSLLLECTNNVSITFFRRHGLATFAVLPCSKDDYPEDLLGSSSKRMLFAKDRSVDHSWIYRLDSIDDLMEYLDSLYVHNKYLFE